MWMVRAGEDAMHFEEFKNNKIVAIGWNEIGDFSKAKDPAAVKAMVEQKYMDAKDGWKAISAGMLSRFLFDFKLGDYVLTYNPKERIYLVGKIESPFMYDPSRQDFRNVRSVEWKGQISRDSLSVSTRNTLGAISTLFEIRGEAMNEILSALNAPKTPELVEEKEQLDEIRQETVRKAHEFIKDDVSKLDWDDVQELVAGILRAMGFKTRVSPQGSDRGKDVEASPDGVGLSEPHIVAEVKHREGTTGASQIRSFIGGLRPRHKGLYVSTGGFTKEAKYEADRATNQVTLIDLDDLVSLIVQYYDDFDAEARSLIALRKIYWPD